MRRPSPPTPACAEVTAFYQERRDRFLSLVAGSRFAPLACRGTFFQMLDYSAITGERDADFAVRLTEEHGVAAIPVSPFLQRRGAARPGPPVLLRQARRDARARGRAAAAGMTVASASSWPCCSCSFGSVRAQQAPLPDAEAFFAAARENLARAGQAQQRYAYKERRTELHRNPFGRIGHAAVHASFSR